MSAPFVASPKGKLPMAMVHDGLMAMRLIMTSERG